MAKFAANKRDMNICEGPSDELQFEASLGLDKFNQVLFSIEHRWVECLGFKKGNNALRHILEV